MFCLFIASLSFSRSLAIKCLFLNDEPCIVRPTLIELNPVELKYYPFLISLNKFTGSYNDLSPNICVPNKAKDISIKAFNMITSKIHVIVNANSIVQYLIQIKNGIIKHVNVNVKIILRAKKNYIWNPITCISDNSKYLKGITDTSVTKCDKL